MVIFLKTPQLDLSRFKLTVTCCHPGYKLDINTTSCIKNGAYDEVILRLDRANKYFYIKVCNSDLCQDYSYTPVYRRSYNLQEVIHKLDSIVYMQCASYNHYDMIM